MKKILCIVALLCSASLLAQERADKGVFLEMNVGYGQHPDRGFAVLTPAIGYRFQSNWSVGARVQCPVGEGQTALGVFAQYRFFNRPRFELFAEGQTAFPLGYDSRADADPDAPRSYADNPEIGVTLGASYAIVKRLRVQVRYLYLGYSDMPASCRSSACWGDGGFVLDAGWNRLQVGLQYTF